MYNEVDKINRKLLFVTQSCLVLKVQLVVTLHFVRLSAQSHSLPQRLYKKYVSGSMYCLSKCEGLIHVNFDISTPIFGAPI